MKKPSRPPATTVVADEMRLGRKLCSSVAVQDRVWLEPERPGGSHKLVRYHVLAKLIELGMVRKAEATKAIQFWKLTAKGSGS